MPPLQSRPSNCSQIGTKHAPNLSRLTDGKTRFRCHTRHIIHPLSGVSIIDATTMPSTATPAWIVYAWAPVLWQAASAPQLHLVHLGTRVLTFGDDDAPCSGQTLWGDHSEACAAGAAWDWVEVRQ